MTQTPNKLQSWIKLGRWLTLSGYFSLLFGLFAWHLLIDHTAEHLISIIIHKPDLDTGQGLTDGADFSFMILPGLKG